MYESIPVVMGVLIALGCHRIRSGAMRTAVSAGLGVPAAYLASWINGEQPAWPLLIGMDMLFVAAGIAAGRLTLGAASRLARVRTAS